MQSSADYMTALWSQPSMADSTTSGQGGDSWNMLVVSLLISSSIQNVYWSAAQGSKKTSRLITEVSHDLPWIFIRLCKIPDGQLAHLHMDKEIHGNIRQGMLDNRHCLCHRWYPFTCISSQCRAFNSARYCTWIWSAKCIWVARSAVFDIHIVWLAKLILHTSTFGQGGPPKPSDQAFFGAIFPSLRWITLSVGGIV